jgi:glyoxalase family protein
MQTHHVTAIAGDPQANVNFYEGLLGLRLVKRTVNYDDPGTWHLYYGDGVGSPGTLLTFFPWTGLPPMVRAQGRRGAGQLDAVQFRIPAGSVEWWTDRLASRAVDFDGPARRFGAAVIGVRDPDGLLVELVATGGAGVAHPWRGAPVPPEHAIVAVDGVSMVVNDVASTSAFVRDVLGFEPGGDEEARHRFTAGGSHLDVVVEPGAAPGRMGIGAIHHVAWRAADDAEQARWSGAVEAAGIPVTPVQDRKYFRSVYFREPAGVVFEIATDGPGFGVDEADAELGMALQLPAWLEPRRERIAARLPHFTSAAEALS